MNVTFYKNCSLKGLMNVLKLILINISLIEIEELID